MDKSPYDYEYEEPGSRRRARYSPRYGQGGERRAPASPSTHAGDECRRRARAAEEARMRIREGRPADPYDPYGPRRTPPRVRRIDPYAYLDSYETRYRQSARAEQDRYEDRRGYPAGERNRETVRRNARGRNSAAQPARERRAGYPPRTRNGYGSSHAPRSQRAPHATARDRFDKIDQNLGSAISARVIVGIVTILFVILVVSVIGRLVGYGQQTEGTYVTDTIKKIQTIADSSKMSEDEVEAKLEGIGVETDWAEKAATLSQTDARFQRIAESSAKIGESGPEISNKLLKLAVTDPEAVDYVIDFAASYPKKKAQAYSDKVNKGTVPVLYQWDKRWGYTEYSSAAFGCTGCGPTTMSMVYMGLTGENDMSPADMAAYATANGFETENEGTLNAFFEAAAGSFGLSFEEPDVDSQSLEEALESGKLVICNVGPGDFTDNGHFIVLTGLDSEGNLKVNDPFSSVNSKKTWDIDEVIAQTKALYAFDA